MNHVTRVAVTAGRDFNEVSLLENLTPDCLLVCRYGNQHHGLTDTIRLLIKIRDEFVFVVFDNTWVVSLDSSRYESHSSG